MIQRGENSKYPKEIYIWRKNDPVPEWLSDIAQIKFLDGNGNISLHTRAISNGGFEILVSGTQEVLVRAKYPDSFICYGRGSGIFSLTPKQMELLYREK